MHPSISPIRERDNNCNYFAQFTAHVILLLNVLLNARFPPLGSVNCIILHVFLTCFYAAQCSVKRKISTIRKRKLQLFCTRYLTCYYAPQCSVKCKITTIRKRELQLFCTCYLTCYFAAQCSIKCKISTIRKRGKSSPCLQMCC